MTDAVAIDEPSRGADRGFTLRVLPSAFPGRRSRLCADFLAGRGQVREFFGPEAGDDGALLALAERLRERRLARDTLDELMRTFARDACAPAAATAQLARLSQPTAVTVFAGQQPGLFTGPLLTVYKALTVERWAVDLETRLKLPVIPCFWLADGDHDWREVDHVEVPSGDTLLELCLAPPSGRGRAIGELRLDETIGEVLEALTELLPASELARSVLDTLAECYAPGTTLSLAFARLWYRLFPESRLVFVPASSPGLRRLAAPLLAAAASEHDSFFERYAEDTRRLTDYGYHAQVCKRPDQSFLFCDEGSRAAIRREADGSFRLPGGERVGARQLHDLVLSRPQLFSPNALLRPLVQNAAFPVLGVVLGPSELAYHAQIAGLHDHCGLPRPAVLPRTSATFLEQHAARHVRELGIDLRALSANPAQETARVLGAGFPRDLDARFRQTAARVETAVRELGSELAAIDPEMERAMQACARRTRRELVRAAGKVHALYRRQHRETASVIRRLANQLVPSGEPQERHVNIAWYWARYGTELLRELHRQWPAGADHVLLMPA